MARLVSAKCPNCGGNVRIGAQLDHVTCQFCGHSAFIEGRSRAPLPVGQPVFRVEQPARTSWAAIVIPLVLLLAVGGAVGASFYLRGGPGSIGRGIRLVAGWAQPMVGDANGDDVQDLITWMQVVRGGTTYSTLAAYDGRNGKELWTADGLTESASQHNMAVAVMSGRLLIGDAGGKLHGHDLATGKRLWTQPLGERVDHYCRTDELLEVVTKDEQHRWFDPTTGKPAEAPAQGAPAATADAGSDAGPEPGWCERPSSDAKGVPAGLARLAWHDEELREHPLPTIEDFSPGNVLRRRSGPYLVLGNKQSGTRVPLVAAVSKGKVLWSTEVPPTDPLSVEEGAPEIATIAAGRAFVVYGKRARKGYRLTAFKLRNGERLWDVALPVKEGDWPYTIATSKRYVFVGERQAVTAVSIAKGKVRYTVR